MLKKALFLIPAIIGFSLLISSTGCMTLLDKNFHKSPDIITSLPPQPPIALNASYTTSQQNHKYIILYLLKKNTPLLLGIAAFLALLGAFRTYHHGPINNQKEYMRLTMEELGLLQLMKNVSSKLWDNHKPRRNVIRFKKRN